MAGVWGRLRTTVGATPRATAPAVLVGGIHGRAAGAVETAWSRGAACSALVVRVGAGSEKGSGRSPLPGRAETPAGSSLPDAAVSSRRASTSGSISCKQELLVVPAGVRRLAHAFGTVTVDRGWLQVAWRAWEAWARGRGSRRRRDRPDRQRGRWGVRSVGSPRVAAEARKWGSGRCRRASQELRRCSAQMTCKYIYSILDLRHGPQESGPPADARARTGRIATW